MKKILFISFVMLLLLSTAGCRKIYDQYISNPKQVERLCKITQLKVYDDGKSAIYNLSYDKNGNITSMLLDNFFTAWHYNFYFRYDKKNRLTDCQFAYPGQEGVIGWDSYIYFNDRIMDTSYFYEGRINDSHPPYGAISKKWAELKTDAHGRVSRVITFVPLSIPPTTNMYIDTVYYKYNKDGNLIFEAPILPPIYDDKINPYLTNSMWQLVNRDYSVNNATDNFSYSSVFPAIVKYNAYGLPVKYVRPGNSGYSFVKFSVACDSLEITYDCDVPKKPY